MTSVGRYKAKEWSEFEAVKEGDGSKSSKDKQKCKHCSEKISSKIERLRQHLQKCKNYLRCKELEDDSSGEMAEIHQLEIRKDGQSEIFALDQLVASTMSTSQIAMDPFVVTSTPCKRSSSVLSNISDMSTDTSITSKKSKTSSIQPSIDRFVQKTSKTEKELLDLQFARTFYACNIPFNVAENVQLKKLITMLRSSYTSPSRQQLRTNLLDSVYEECKETFASNLKGQQVTMIQDGWSNIHNQSIISTCLHNGTNSFFIRSVETGSEKKTAEYCTKIAEEEIHYCETTFGCKVIAFCSASEAKMVLTRKKIQERFQTRHTNEEGRLLFVYGCAAHYLNLVESEVTPKTVLNKVIEVQKYFRNHHQPAGWLLEKNGVKPQLPNATRWNSQDDCIDTYLKNNQKYLEIAMEHELQIDKNIVAIIKNATIHMESMHLQKQLKKVSTALNTMQRDDCTLGDVVHVWMDLINAPELKPYTHIIQKRFDQCITPLHLVAYQAHPKYKGHNLSESQTEKVCEWIRNINPLYVAPLLSLSIEDEGGYPKSMLEESLINSLAPTKWWRIIGKKFAKADKLVTFEFCQLMIMVSSLPASSAASASIERIFSNFGLIHTKLRNRLGNETAEKLVMCHRLLKDIKCDDHEW